MWFVGFFKKRVSFNVIERKPRGFETFGLTGWAISLMPDAINCTIGSQQDRRVLWDLAE